MENKQNETHSDNLEQALEDFHAAYQNLKEAYMKEYNISDIEIIVDSKDSLAFVTTDEYGNINYTDWYRDND